MTKTFAAGLLFCLATAPALAQSSVEVQAGNLRGSAQAGQNSNHRDRQVARGPRTDDTSNCDTRGVTVRSGNGSASASVTTSGGSSVVAGGGSPGSRTEYFGCDAPTHQDNNRSSR